MEAHRPTGLFRQLRSSIHKVARPLIDLSTLNTINAQQQQLLNQEDLDTRLENALNIQNKSPSELYEVNSKSVRLHQLTKHKMFTCRDREDGSIWTMTKMNDSKAAVIYEFGVLALYPHDNLTRLREVLFYKERFFVFTAQPPGMQLLKKVIFNPTFEVDLLRGINESESETFSSSNLTEVVLNIPENDNTSGLRFRQKPWPEDMVCYVLGQVLQGLAHLHENNVIHRDVRAETVSVNSYGQVHLCDLLLSRVLTAEKPRSRTLKGSVHFMSPETMRGWEYDTISDMWTFGIFAHQVANGRVPFENISDTRKVMQKVIANPPEPFNKKETWSHAFEKVVASCLNHNPSARPKASKLLSDKWFLSAAPQQQFARFLENFS